jgi:hypothetical protein
MHIFHPSDVQQTYQQRATSWSFLNATFCLCKQIFDKFHNSPMQFYCFCTYMADSWHSWKIEDVLISLQQGVVASQKQPNFQNQSLKNFKLFIHPQKEFYQNGLKTGKINKLLIYSWFFLFKKFSGFYLLTEKVHNEYWSPDLCYHCLCWSCLIKWPPYFSFY